MSSDPYVRLYGRLSALPWDRLALDGGTDGPAAFPYRLVGELAGQRVEIAAERDPRAGAERWTVAVAAEGAPPHYRILEGDAAVTALLRDLANAPAG